MDPTPYLARGVNLLATESSVLVSSSKYLNSARLREWVALAAMRRNGPDYPPAAEMHELIQILAGLRDFEKIATGVASIGGAGTFDGIVAAYLA